MLKIQVLSFDNQPVAQPLGADFDEMGGSIGRSAGNTLVLPDEKRYISRTQASIVCRQGAYFLRDHGSASPTLVNGTAVGNDNEVTLHDGDAIAIGEYRLSVSMQGGSPAGLAADPFADLLAPANPSMDAQRAPMAAAAARPIDRLDDPFSIPPAAPAPMPQAGAIPSDFDPFADIVPLPAGSKAALPQDFGLSPGTQSVDDVFGLKGGSSSSWDPLAPTDSLSDTPPAPQRAPTQRDDAPILSSAFRPPQPSADRPPAGGPRADNVVVSWDTSRVSTNEIKSVILPSPKKAPAASPPESAAPRIPQRAPAAAARTDDSVSRHAASRPGDPSSDALLRAFLEGLGVSDLRTAGGLTPEFANLIGQLLREAIGGTLDLLLARALTKREVRAHATVIVARENNPLKFSPTVEAAVANLLSDQGHGFMPPVKAMHDAYIDLRSHQVGLMAGMRAALEGVLARFDPAQLEQRLVEGGVLGSLLASTRRAKLWELYENLYRDILKEAEDDFHKLFGKEFLRAYEAQIDKLEQEDEPSKR